MASHSLSFSNMTAYTNFCNSEVEVYSIVCFLPFSKVCQWKVGTVNLCQGHKRKVGETLTCTGNDYDSYGSQVIKSVTAGMCLLNRLPNTVLRIGPYVITDYGNNHILESYVHRRFACVSKILLSKAVLSPNSFRLHHYNSFS